MAKSETWAHVTTGTASGVSMYRAGGQISQDTQVGMNTASPGGVSSGLVTDRAEMHRADSGCDPADVGENLLGRTRQIHKHDLDLLANMLDRVNGRVPLALGVDQ